MMSRRKKGKKKIVFFFIFLILLLSAGLYYFIYIHKSDNEVVEKIEKYNYTLESDDTKLTNNIFAKLKETLSAKEIDYEAYAKEISKLFIVDLYTMNNKLNKYDVGGTKYIYPASIDNFKLKVQETLYKYLEDIENRKQELPEVNSIEIVNINNTNFKYQEIEYEGYEIKLSWTYKKDLDYDNEGIVTIIKENDTLYVAKFTPRVSVWKDLKEN